MINLLKYDLSAISKRLLPAYAVTFGMSLLTRLTTMADSITIFAVLSMITGLFSLAATVVLVVYTFIVCIRRFYTNLFRDEGYITNMLPLSISSHIISKSLSAFVFSIATIGVSVGSLVTIYYGLELTAGISQIVSQISGMLIEFLVLLVLTFLAYQLLVFAAYSLGQMNEKKKMMHAMFFAAGLYLVNQLLNLSGLGIISLLRPGFFNTLITNPESVILMIIRMTIIMLVICCFVYYIITITALRKKMDLE